MLARVFPKQIDNASYRGHWIAIVLLGLVAFLRLLMGVNSILNTRSVAVGADALPLDSFGPAGAQAVLSLFALNAMSNVTLGLLSVIVLLRYRAMIPLTLLLLLFDHVGRRLLLYLHPVVERAESAAPSVGFYLTSGILAALLIGLVFSLFGGRPK